MTPCTNVHRTKRVWFLQSFKISWIQSQPIFDNILAFGPNIIDKIAWYLA